MTKDGTSIRYPPEASSQVLFKPGLEVEEQYWSYTGLSYFAEMGGYLGIFIGVSVFDASEKVLAVVGIVVARLRGAAGAEEWNLMIFVFWFLRICTIRCDLADLHRLGGAAGRAGHFRHFFIFQ